MKKTKSPIFFRYEFSDEAGVPEGGDVFQYATHAKVQAMVAEILKVAHSDQVTVNLTIGFEKPFFGFLKHSGLSRQDVEKEMVRQETVASAIAIAPLSKKSSQAKSSKKSKTKKKK
jgi:hypothetical protein